MKIVKKGNLKLYLFLEKDVAIKCKHEDLDILSKTLIDNGFINDCEWNEMVKNCSYTSDYYYIAVYENNFFSFFTHNCFDIVYTKEEIFI